MPLVIPGDTKHRTKQEFVYQTLRDAIMTCALLPGERLVLDDLARRLRVSTIPVREALQMLQSEALVVNVPHAGATVAPVSRESIQDTFTVLEGLETVATKLVAERATAEDLETLAAIVDRMDETMRQGHYDQWAELNRRFHLTISMIPGLALLREMTERVLDRWGRVRRYYFKGVLVHRVAQAQEEHRAILAALRARDIAAAQDLVRRHNQSALAAYLEYLKASGRGQGPGPRKTQA